MKPNQNHQRLKSNPESSEPSGSAVAAETSEVAEVSPAANGAGAGAAAAANAPVVEASEPGSPHGKRLGPFVRGPAVNFAPEMLQDLAPPGASIHMNCNLADYY